MYFIDGLKILSEFVQKYQDTVQQKFISACDPMDDGPIPPVAPTLYLSITEATQEGKDKMGHFNEG